MRGQVVGGERGRRARAGARADDAAAAADAELVFNLAKLAPAKFRVARAMCVKRKTQNAFAFVPVPVRPDAFSRIPHTRARLARRAACSNR